MMIRIPKRMDLSALLLVLAAAGTPADALYRNGLALQLDAGKISGMADGAALTCWIDASGQGNDAVAGVAPTYLADGGGGYPAVRFDGIEDYLETALPTGTNASVFMVYANRRDPLPVQHRDTLLSSSSTEAGIDLAASHYVDGMDVVQFGWDKSVLFNAAYQSQVGADEIIQWDAVDSMDGGTWYNGGTLPNLDDAGIGASLTSPSFNVVMTTRSISSADPSFTNTVVSSNGRGLAVGPSGGSDIYFRESSPAAWGFKFDRDVELRQILFDGMGHDSDRIRITVEGGGAYTLGRDDCDETSAWSGDGSLEVYTFASPIVLSAGTKVTVEPAASGDAVNNNWQVASVVIGVPRPPPDYPGFVARRPAGVEVETRVNGRSTADAGTDVFRDRYYIGSAVYRQSSAAPSLTIGAQEGGSGAFGQNDIREILVYNHALDESEHNAVLEYLGEKYGIEVVSRPLDHPVEAYNHILGAQQIGRQYTFGEANVQVLDAARAIYRQGSRVFKLALSDKYAYQNGVQDDPSIDSLAKVVRDEPGIRAVLDMPFTDILFWASTFSVPKWGQVATDTGLDAATQQLIYDEIYDFTAHLLTTYSGSGKSFYIGNWEGDWLLAGEGSQDPENDITLAKINGMIDWATVRQQAIDDAKAATPHSGVDVWYYLEMNRGDWAVDGRPCIVNSVMPHLSKLDYISFSSYSIREFNEAETHAALDAIHNALPTNSPPPGSRLIIGEYGYGQQTMSQQQQTQLYIDKIGHYLSWSNGPPRFILMWEFFWNELGGAGNWKNMHQISPDNERHALYYLHENFFRDMRRWVEVHYETDGTLPARPDYAAEAVLRLNRISLAEYLPDLRPKESLLIQFGGSVNSFADANWQTQIGAGQIIQWNGASSWGGGDGSQGTLHNRGTGAVLSSSNDVLSLTSRMIYSDLPEGTNTFMYGPPNLPSVLGVIGADNAKFDTSQNEAWAFSFNQDVILKRVMIAAVDDDLEAIRVDVPGTEGFDITRLNSGANTWAPSTKRYTYTVEDGGLALRTGTEVTISSARGQVGLQGIVVGIPGASSVYDYEAWAAEWGVDIGMGFHDYDGDGVPNIYEFGLGGDPIDPDDSGSLPSYTVLDDDGTRFVQCIYLKRSDPLSGLDYYLETTEELLPAAWTNAGYTVTGIHVTEGQFDYVTNRIETAADSGFIRLIIE